MTFAGGGGWADGWAGMLLEDKVASHYEHQIALALMLRQRDEAADLSLDTFGGCACAIRFLQLTFDRFKKATLPLLPPQAPPRRSAYAVPFPCASPSAALSALSGCESHARVCPAFGGGGGIWGGGSV